MSDYIKREDAVCVALAAKSLGNTAYSDRFEIASRIRHLPTADVVERKVGRCLPKARYFYCSKCGYAVADVFEGAYDHDDEKVFVFEHGESWSYCPNCGADMRGGE